MHAERKDHADQMEKLADQVEEMVQATLADHAEKVDQGFEFQSPFAIQSESPSKRTTAHRHWRKQTQTTRIMITSPALL